FERGQVDHAQRELERVDLRILLDAARPEAGDALLDPHFVDVRHALEIGHAGRQCDCAVHAFFSCLTTGFLRGFNGSKAVSSASWIISSKVFWLSSVVSSPPPGI